MLVFIGFIVISLQISVLPSVTYVYGNQENLRRGYSGTWETLIDSSDNIIIISPYQYDSNESFTGVDGFQIIKFNPSGNLLWSKDFEKAAFIFHPVIDKDNNILFLSYRTYQNRINLTKISSNGDWMWTFTFDLIESIGSNFPYLTNIIIDDENNVMLTGVSNNLNFPMAGSYQNSIRGGDDVVVVKISSEGKLIWSTYLGGNNDEILIQSSLDKQGNVILYGRTFSLDFPVTLDDRMETATDDDIFISMFTNDGDLKWSHVVGGGLSDDPLNFIYDNNDDVIFLARSNSIDLRGINSIQQEPYDQYDQTNLDIGNPYLGKITREGELIWSTFITGDGISMIGQIDIDKSNNIIVLGTTNSSEILNIDLTEKINFTSNITENGDLKIKSFIIKISNDGSLEWIRLTDYNAGALMAWVDFEEGWTSPEHHFSIDRSSNIFVTGVTTNSEFINQLNPLLPYSGNQDIYLVKINPNGNIEWSTFIGGHDSEVVQELCVNKDGSVILAGFTNSDDLILKNPFQEEYGGGEGDLFVIQFSNEGDFQWGTYLGGSSHESQLNLLLNDQNQVIIIARTSSPEYPIKNAYNSTANGSDDIVITQFNKDGSVPFSSFLGPVIEIEFEDDKNWFNPNYITIGLLFFLGITMSTFYYLQKKPKGFPNESIDNIISSFTDVNPEVVYLITGANRCDLSKQLKKEFQSQVPPELYQLKFLLHPVKLSILKILSENVSITNIALKNELGISWADVNNNLKLMRNKDLLRIKDNFVDNNVRKVVYITPHGSKQFDFLRITLMDFLNIADIHKYIQEINELQDTMYPKA